MQLIDIYKRSFVGQMFPSKLLKILRGEHPSIYIRNVVNGVVIFSNNKVLRCIENYYEVPGGRKVQGGKNNQYLRCKNIRDAYDIFVPDNDCSRCHLACLEAEQNGDLKRKSFRKKTRKDEVK